LNYLGIKTPIETLNALMHLEGYAKRRQIEEDLAFWQAQGSKATDPR
jgi:hypothetical protein